ncbi:hypothetical protein I302_103806 [Kwoniella bestiolae CBS 10118]|uniref:Uncharacterized protein n=1 Tax=Kwoniella bestiolae CBS 10118 TaxID=1296100 RepID=A0A1B9G9E4_9TREE|nr:hypothetical protein I302_02509 [Kwoniella bestiolae CBS 10118]OCF27665.1 hypothetical protein I302_02509 [Kwoniella bestiolae CBS 10118]
MQPRPIPSNPSHMDNTMMVDNEMSSPPNGHAHAQGVVSPLIGSGLTFSKITENVRPIRPSTPPIPIRFATTTNAFGLSPSTSTTTSSSSPSTNTNPLGMRVDISPPSAGSITTRKLRRPSMLSLQQNFSFGSDNSGGKADDEATPMGEANININMVQDPSSSKSTNNAPAPFNSNTLQPTPRWAGHGGSFANAMIRRTSSAPIIPFEDLKTSTPPITAAPHLPDDSGMMMDMEDDSVPSEDTEGEQSTLQWMPSHLKAQSSSNLRKGKGKMDDTQNGMDLLSPTHTPISARGQVFTGKPLPNALLKTLASEERPLDQEIESEAKLQKFLLSHPTKLPLTPKTSASGNTKYRNSRGRFPDQVGGDDDELEDDSLFSTALANRRSTSWTTTLSRRSRNWMDRARFDDDTDTESDEEEEDEEVLTNTSNPNGNKGKEEPVNSAFAAGMDMDRPGSSSSSSLNMWTGTGSISNSGKSTPPHQAPLAGVGIGMGNPFPTPPSTNNSFPPNFTNTNRSARLSFSQTQSQGMVPSPGYGLPSAFGGLGMGGNGLGTPLGSPTVERAELGASPSASGTMGVGSPGLMLYRESQGGQATVRPGKRKAQAEDRFDPYKRPRGSSPSLMNSSPFPISPSRTNAIPIPQSPSHAPLYPSSLSSLSTSHPRHTQHGRPTHPYTRPMTSRSRAASPALSIGSTNGLSSSLGNKGFTLNGNGSGNGSGNWGQQPQQQLGGLGLLSLQNSRVDEEDEDGREGGEEMRRVDSEEKMEED